MRSKWIWIIFFALLWVAAMALPANAKGIGLPSQFWAYGGKLFAGFQDPEFTNYDIALRNYLAKRINKRFGITLDPKTYSGFDLLEIEALIKCKKSDEPVDIFLKMFPKIP